MGREQLGVEVKQKFESKVDLKEKMAEDAIELLGEKLSALREATDLLHICQLIITKDTGLWYAINEWLDNHGVNRK